MAEEAEVVEGAEAPEIETPDVDILGMDDAEFMNQLQTMANAEPAAEAPAEAQPAEAAPAVEGEGAAPAEAEAVDKTTDTPAEGTTDPATPAAEPAVEAAPIDYKAAYERLMAPIKANGKTIDLRDPEELVTLAQMGANYTRKMQDLAPHRKLLTMVQTAGLDEDKLSFLIDLDKKNPEAVKKLLKDAGIDPMEIDTATEPAYLAGNHRVSDEEVNFKSAMDDLGSNPSGRETLSTIAGWDQSSKAVLWNSPELMATIHSQRETGIYDRIVAEVDRQKTLGRMPADTSFLEAYKTVGDRMKDAGAFNDLAAPEVKPVVPAAEPTPAKPAAVATTVVTPKPAVGATDRVAAASPSRAAPSDAKEIVNVLAMSDDDFMKHLNKFTGRL